MVARRDLSKGKEINAQLLFNGQLVKIDIVCTITGEYSFLNTREYTIKTEPVFEFNDKIDFPITGDNLFLIQCKKDTAYKLCISYDPIQKLASLQEGSRHKLEILVCCPDNSVFILYLYEKYKIKEEAGWFEIEEDKLKEMVQEMTMKRYTESITIEENKEIIECNKEVSTSKESSDSEEDSLPPKYDSQLSDCEAKQDIKPIAKVVELVKREDLTSLLGEEFYICNLGKEKGCLGKKDSLDKITIYGRFLSYTEYLHGKCTINTNFEVTVDKIFDIWNYYATDKNYCNTTFVDKMELFNNLPEKAIQLKDIMKKINTAEKERQDFLATLRLVCKTDRGELYEKKLPSDCALICRGGFVEIEETWMYHYNQEGVSLSEKYSYTQGKRGLFDRRSQVALVKDILIAAISISDEVRKKVQRQYKKVGENGGSYSNEIAYTDVVRSARHLKIMPCKWISFVDYIGGEYTYRCNYSPSSGKHIGQVCGSYIGSTATYGKDKHDGIDSYNMEPHHCNKHNLKKDTVFTKLTVKQPWITKIDYNNFITKGVTVCNYCPKEGQNKDKYCGLLLTSNKDLYTSITKCGICVNKMC